VAEWAKEGRVGQRGQSGPKGGRLDQREAEWTKEEAEWAKEEAE